MPPNIKGAVPAGALWKRELVVPEGLEPPTPTLGKWRSIRLSYGTTPPDYPQGGRRVKGQLLRSGGTTGNGSGATGTPSSTSDLASAGVAWPWMTA